MKWQMTATLPDSTHARAPRRRRRSWLPLVCGLILTVQFVVGLAGTLTPQGEIFPFASWFLFSLRPDRVISYELILRTSERRPPVPFNRAGGLVKAPHSVTVYQLTQQLGRALELRQALEVRRLRREIEAQFAASGIRYDVVRVCYQLADRWKSQQPPATEPVASFAQGEGFEP